MRFVLRVTDMLVHRPTIEWYLIYHNNWS